MISNLNVNVCVFRKVYEDYCFFFFNKINVGCYWNLKIKELIRRRVSL